MKVSIVWVAPNTRNLGEDLVGCRQISQDVPNPNRNDLSDCISKDKYETFEKQNAIFKGVQANL